MRPIKKEHKQRGIAIALGVHLLVFLFFIFTSFDNPNKEDTEKIVAIIDFSGGGGAEGGAENKKQQEEIEEKVEETESSDSSEEVLTQETKAPTSSSKAPAPKKNTKSSAQKEEKQKPKYGNLGGLFKKGSGKGKDEGDRDGGSKKGTGKGDGPNVGSGDGIGDGKNRILKYKPNFVNPTQETGKVAVQITINRDGKVIKALALASSKLTTTANIKLHRSAEEHAKQLKFNSTSNGPKYDKMVTTINFKLN